MLSYTCKAAIKSVLYLATRIDQESRASIKDIADAIQASEHTAAKMLQQLARQQIIHSVKGPLGGFYISREQFHQPLMQIVVAIDGAGIFRDCGLGLSQCSEVHPCPIHNQYKDAREKIKKLFEQTTIQELSRKLEKGQTFIADLKM